jgi:two-component system NtrC family sensor kinase
LFGKWDMKNLTLRKKFSLLFLGIFCVPFGLLTFLSASMSRGVLEQNTMLHFQNLVEIKETAIEQWVQERIRDGRMLIESGEIKSLDPKRMEPLLNFKKDLHKGYPEFLVADLKGKEIAIRPPRRNLEKEEWFRGAMDKGLYVSSPIVLESSEFPVLIISLLIKDRAGKALGVLKEVVSMDYVAHLIFESYLGETGKFYLANPRGEILLEKRPSDLPIQGMPRVPYFENVPFRPFHTAVYVNSRGNEVLGSWKWVQGLGCYLIAEQDTKEAFHQSHLLTRRAFILFVASTLAVLLIAYWAVGTVTRPLRSLGETVASFSEGQFQKAIVADRKDEIGKLMDGFTKMAAKLEKAYAALEGKVQASNTELEKAYFMLKQKQEQLIRSAKMAALGQLSAGVAHEIRNPLTSIKIFIQSLEKQLDLDETQQEDFRIIKKEMDRLNEIVIRFLNFARPEEPQFQAVNMRGLVMDALNLLVPRIRNNGIRLVISLAPDLPAVKGDPKQLDQVLLNLLLNAVEAMPMGGTLEVRSGLKTVPESEGKLLQIVIRDSGPGIGREEQARLFDPFFSTKEGGTGLGLSIVYSIVQKHDGQIDVESELGKGTSFILSLPLFQEEGWKKSSSSTTI